ncbi:MAG: mercuric reductase [Vicinamibacterales bacterium]|nr:mercuric reductase [Vicinamibacterales bacterium]
MSSRDHLAEWRAARLPQAQPLDDTNRRWLEHTHPSQWTNPTPDGRYNLVVIGGGTAGLVTAAGAAGLGAKVAIIERDLLGGDCLNVGCVPSKALIRSARAIGDVRGAGAFGVRVPDGVTVDFPRVMARMRELRAAISPHDSAARFRQLGVDVFLGEGRFTSPTTVEVDGRTLTFARACVATGARASAPPIPGLDDAGYLTNETVFSLTALPRRLAVIGAGPIGCELAQAFARFGSEVSLIEMMPRPLPNEDPDAAALVQRALVADGIRVLCGSKDLRVGRDSDGKRLTLEVNGATQEVVVDEILVGVGRAPNVDGLGLEAAGVAYDRSGVTVNDFLQTSAPHIYAAGDIASRYKFTHAADALARVVIQNALFFGRRRASALTIPWCTYTDPEVAHVGLYPKDAEAQGVAIDTYTIEHAKGDRAILDGETEGFLKVYTRKGKDTIVGATLVARHAGEMISEMTLAMKAGAGLGTLAATIHPYPTQAEIFKKAGDAYSRTRLTPGVKRLFETVLKWRR